MPVNDLDPYTPSTGVFECTECGSRKQAATHPVTCPDCEGDVRNIAVARE